MQVSILVFASYQDIVGKPEVSLTLDAGATVEDCSQLLIRDYPALALRFEKGRVALNSEFVDGATEVHEGDEVAFLPPMSGG